MYSSKWWCTQPPEASGESRAQLKVPSQARESLLSPLNLPFWLASMFSREIRMHALTHAHTYSANLSACCRALLSCAALYPPRCNSDNSKDAVSKSISLGTMQQPAFLPPGSICDSERNIPAFRSIRMTFFPRVKAQSYLVVTLRAWFTQNFRAIWDVLLNTSWPPAASTETYHLLRSSSIPTSALQLSWMPHGILNGTRCCWCSGQWIKPWLSWRSGEDSH